MPKSEDSRSPEIPKKKEEAIIDTFTHKEKSAVD